MARVGDWRRASMERELRQTFCTGHLRSMFQQAWFNFIRLQVLDFRAAFSCCGGSYVIADGMMLGYKLSKSFLERRWAPHADAPLVAAPPFSERLLIREVQLRRSLLSFCGGAPPPRKFARNSGLTEEQLEELMLRLTDDYSYLLPLLDRHVLHKGHCFARNKARCVLLVW